MTSLKISSSAFLAVTSVFQRPRRKKNNGDRHRKSSKWLLMDGIVAIVAGFGAR
jgi:hypothetical protein